MVAINPDAKRITYSYDFMDRRVVMRNPEGGRFSSTYDAKGRLIRHVNPQSKRTTIAWDVLDRKREERIANRRWNSRRASTGR